MRTILNIGLVTLVGCLSWGARAFTHGVSFETIHPLEVEGPTGIMVLTVSVSGRAQDRVSEHEDKVQLPFEESGDATWHVEGFRTFPSGGFSNAHALGVVFTVESESDGAPLPEFEPVAAELEPGEPLEVALWYGLDLRLVRGEVRP